ncbi:MAG TPA: thioredoxin domain-containing protein [Acidobacteriaceae bacterium]|nr:thioredoxin domain-containing protein [Acidobacteriaceae bacterium]
MHRGFTTCLLAGTVAFAAGAFAQTETPSAPAPQSVPNAPSAPAQETEPKFPPVNPADFTIAAPTKEEVNAFLKASWGYDENRVWEVVGIQKTAAPGIARVTALVAEKPNPQIADFSFLVTPDGHHLISSDQSGYVILDFAANPYANNFRVLQQRADGPSQGPAGKEHELVEFADFQCPHCKEAEPIVQKLLKDFPQAHYVFESFPLVNIHPSAFKAAAFGACVAQQGGADAFFKYADSVFAGQEALAGQGADQALRNAVTAAGLDPDKIAACSDNDAAKNSVHASMQLGQDLNVDQTPWLFVDGRGLPMLEVPYEQLKKIIDYQFAMDK